MTLDLATILQTGGPTSFALLFAWLWHQTKQELKDERAARQALIDKLLRKAGITDA